MAVFAPGDATMLYCITPQGVKLRSLRALPECTEYCESVDQHNPHASSVQGTKGLLLMLVLQYCLRPFRQQLLWYAGKAYAAEAKKSGAFSVSHVDPAAR